MPGTMWQLILAGTLVHVILFYSIFDIYFTSPLVHGMTPQTSPTEAPAQRLVLFVADGLRADTFFKLNENGQSYAPYLRSIIEKHGSWGISHTHMPTESRPGHVAMIAGFYEDVSAVAKGWKENPVMYDSVFNESRFTWGWGSPDILPMFSRGATRGHVMTECYPESEEDFASSNSSRLDTWVFKKFRTFLESAGRNDTLHRMLQADKIVLFLHLLGIDVNGHSHKPHSREYKENIAVVDGGVRDVVNLLNDFYGHDSKTAYIMSSDHGMTNWDWNLSHVTRMDVQQADIAPLMACLIGVPYPLNSVGTLPLDYLDATDAFKADNIFTNARQILAQFQTKMAEKQQTSFSYFFRPFLPLTVAKQADFLRNISRHLQNGRYLLAIEESKALIGMSLEGLSYYHTYDRYLLWASIALGFFGWIAYIVCYLLASYSRFVTPQTGRDRRNTPRWRSERSIKIAFSALGAVMLIVMLIQLSPLTHIVYTLLPILLWCLVALSFSPVTQLVNHIYTSGQAISAGLMVVKFMIGLELLVESFFHRGYLSLTLLLMAAEMSASNRRLLTKATMTSWCLCCLLLSVFPLLPVVGRKANHDLVVLAGCLIIACGVLLLVRFRHQTAVKSNSSLYLAQLALIGLSSYIVKSTAASIADNSGLPLFNQVMSWMILATSLIVPLCSTTRIVDRSLSLHLSLAAPSLLLSIAHEGLFLISFCVVLFFWLYLEHFISLNKTKLADLVFNSIQKPVDERAFLSPADFRISYYCLLLFLTAFFGTGNIASINSFDPTSVYCFLTVFSPFTMGALMIFKNVIPFLLVVCTFHAVHISTRLPSRAFFFIVLIMSDLMAFRFFLLIQETGSWLDIGSSISHYVIMMTMILFFLLLHGVTLVITSWKIVEGLHIHVGKTHRS